MTTKNNSTVYVGNLPDGLKEHEFEDIFVKYGRIVRTHFRGSSYAAYVQFEERRDALEAVRRCNGHSLRDNELKVEMSRGPWGPSLVLPKRTSHRVLIENLPPSATMEELKKHMEMGGVICHAEVNHEGKHITGEVEYKDERAMNYAIKKLDGSWFKNKFFESRITVEKYDDSYKAKTQKQSDSEVTVQRNSDQVSRPYHKHSTQSRNSDQDSRTSHKHLRSPSRNSYQASRPARKHSRSPSRKSHDQDSKPSHKQSRSSSRSPPLANKRRRV